MSCGARGCIRTLRTQPLYCRCGLSFCSEPCFVKAWHAEHQKCCPNAAEIAREVQERRAKSSEKSATLLVGVALSRLAPSTSPRRAAEPEADPAPPKANALSSAAPGPEVLASSAALSGPSQPPPALAPSQPTAPAPAQAERPPFSALAQVQASTSSAPSAASPMAAKATSSVARPEENKVIRYEKDQFVPVGGPIGNGSYGQVRKVVHKRNADIFAMKEIPKKKVKDHKMEEYLMREVKLQYKIRHPNILRLHYYFEDAEMVYLLLEYANGGSLFGHLRKRGRLPEHEAAPIFVGVAKALNFMHSHSIVHRDLKPENILMCAGGVAKIADFGWSAVIEDGAPRHTFCGTWDYLSPEMVCNEPHDHTVDTWAVGVLLYEMLTGRAPFQADGQMKVVNRITNVDLQVPEIVSLLAKDLIRKILVKKPQKRLSLEEAIRHEWARRLVRTSEGEASAAASTLSAQQAAQRAATQPASVSQAPSGFSPEPRTVAPAQVQERPVPKPKALSSASRGAAGSSEETSRQAFVKNVMASNLEYYNSSAPSAASASGGMAGLVRGEADSQATKSGSASGNAKADLGARLDAMRQNAGAIFSELATAAPAAAAPQGDIRARPEVPPLDLGKYGEAEKSANARDEARGMLDPETAKLLQELKELRGGAKPAEAKAYSPVPSPRGADRTSGHCIPSPRGAGRISGDCAPSPRALLPTAPAAHVSGVGNSVPIPDAETISPSAASRDEPTSYADTDVFKSIRNWVRKSDKSNCALAEELDRTVPVPNSGTAERREISPIARSWGALPEESEPPEPAGKPHWDLGHNSSPRIASEATQTRTRSWALPSSSTMHSAPTAAKVPVTGGDISPVMCGREPRFDQGWGDSNYFDSKRDAMGLDEAFLDDTVRVNAGAPDPRRLLLGGALVKLAS